MARMDPLSREPTGTVRAPALAVDAGLLCILFAAALLTGSLTLLGETFRSALLLIRGLSDFMTGKRARAGSLARYEFGAGKLEQAWSLAIAIALIVAGLWAAGLTLEVVAAGESHATPRGLSLAAAAFALVTLRNGLSVLSLLHRFDDGSSPAERAQLKSRLS